MKIIELNNSINGKNKLIEELKKNKEENINLQKEIKNINQKCLILEKEIENNKEDKEKKDIIIKEKDKNISLLHVKISEIEKKINEKEKEIKKQYEIKDKLNKELEKKI